MTFFEPLRKAILARVKAQITLGGDGGAVVPTLFEGAPGLTTNAGEGQPQPADALWMEAHVLPGSGRAIEFGGGVREGHPGVLKLLIHWPATRGSAEIDRLADRIHAAFTSRTVAGISYRAASPQPATVAGKWRVVPVDVPYLAQAAVTV